MGTPTPRNVWHCRIPVYRTIQHQVLKTTWLSTLLSPNRLRLLPVLSTSHNKRDRCFCIRKSSDAVNYSRLRLKCDGTRVETRFRLSAKRTSPFKSAGVSVQSTTGRWGVRISGSNARYNMFRGSVKSTGYPLHSPVSPSLPLPCVSVCRHNSPGL